MLRFPFGKWHSVERQCGVNRFLSGGEIMKLFTVLALVLILATSVFAVEKKAFQMREDFGTEPLGDYTCALNYYYYIPCPTYSWFWGFYGWTCGDIIGAWYTIGDYSMFYSGCPDYYRCDPCNEVQLTQIRVLDFAGYGTIYPTLFTVRFDIYCADQYGCPIGTGPPLFTIDNYELHFGWNYIVVNNCEGISVCECYTEVIDGVPCYPRFVITAKMIGTDCTYPQWGFDNIGTPVGDGCVMHDYGCCPALYPRPWISHYASIHSGYYGNCDPHQYCPPLLFCDGYDTSANCDVYGFVEAAWRVYMFWSGPTKTETSTWGEIKSMYR
jgi:hypothetical protein